MKLILPWLIALMLVAPGASAQLKPGDAAPDFDLPGTDGKTHKLSDYRGKRGVVVAWYPKAFTGGCTAECKSLREAGAAKLSAAVFAASVDDPATNRKFAESLGLDFPILSDPTKATAKAYGVLNAERGVANRWTIYIGKDGRIAHIDKEVQTSSHGATVVEQVKKLGLDR